MFRNPSEDLSHGWLVPLVSAYAIWRRILFACAVPLAILGNLARIMSIALVAH